MTPPQPPYETPVRGDIWLAELDPVIGHEQAGTRPVLIVAADTLNRSPAERTIVLPLTSKGKHLSYRVHVTPPEGGVTAESWILCDQIRAISTRRLRKRYGSVGDDILEAVEEQLALLLDL